MAAGIPITYVPARNTVFLSLALAWAETLGAFDIFVGVNCVDYSGYPDCRPEYLRGVRGHGQPGDPRRRRGPGPVPDPCPADPLTKDQIILRGLELGVDYGLTHSCYDPTPDGRACGRCDSCQIRRAAFERLGHRSGSYAECDLMTYDPIQGSMTLRTAPGLSRCRPERIGFSLGSVGMMQEMDWSLRHDRCLALSFSAQAVRLVAMINAISSPEELINA